MLKKNCIKKDEMSSVCSTDVREEKYMWDFVEKPERKRRI
jgi:hypothetical protein